MAKASRFKAWLPPRKKRGQPSSSAGKRQAPHAKAKLARSECNKAKFLNARICKPVCFRFRAWACGCKVAHGGIRGFGLSGPTPPNTKGSPCNVVELTRTIGCVLALSWLYSLKASSKGLLRDYRTCRVEPSIRSEMNSTCQHRGCRFKV